VARVLIVDDHRNSRELLALSLQSYGCHTLTASDIGEALALAAGRRIDVIVSDIRMPSGTGVELACRIRREKLPVDIVLMTAYDLERHERDLLGSLGIPVLIKPVTAGMLALHCRLGDNGSVP
jgi:two-component system response regulator PilR (NtrC family)